MRTEAAVTLFIRCGVAAVAVLVLSRSSSPEAAGPAAVGLSATTEPASGAGLMVERVVGTGEWGFAGDGGPALQARLTEPISLVFDQAGNLYFSDQSNHRVRKVDARTQIISTVVQIAPQYPAGLAFDRHGDLYIADGGSIRRVSMATGIMTTVAGTGTDGFSGDGGPAIAAQFSGVNSLAIDANDNFYIADSGNFRIRKVTAATGTIDTIAGNGQYCLAPAPPGPLVGDARSVCLHPLTVALDPAGRLCIVDNFASDIRRMNLADHTISLFAGSYGDTAADGDGFVATETRITASGGLAIDEAGNVYFTSGNAVRKVSARTGRISTLAGRSSGGTSGDGGPALNATFEAHTLALDPAGNLYVDANGWVREILPNPHDIPLTADMDGDRRADLVVWRPLTGTWFWLTSSSGYDYGSARSLQWGNAALGDRPFLADMDGDGKADPVVWRASTGTWYWLTSSSGYSPAAAGSQQWGNADLGDVPFLGDIDGDGKADLIVWRPTTGTWYWLTSSTGYTPAMGGIKQWGSGALGDMPLLGDIDGDGKADLVVTRRSEQPFESSRPDNWFCLLSTTQYTRDRLVNFGYTHGGERPLLADMDGDGRADLVTWYQPSGVWTWLTAATNFQGPPGAREWGKEAYLDQPLLGDVDGDGKADPIVWRLLTGTWWWLTSSSGYSSGQQKQWGT